MAVIANVPSGISMLMLGVADLNQSVAFYRDQLNFTLRHQTPEFAFFDGGAIGLTLSAPLGRAVSPRAGAVEVIFPVESVSASHNLLIQRGCSFLKEPHEVMAGSWAANLQDPDGHLLTIFGPK